MKLLLSLLLIWLTTTSALAFDRQHTAFDTLLKKHVYWDSAGVASKVDYAGFQQDWPQLKTYLDELSAVKRVEFDRWSKPTRLAFLIIAYNAFTIQLILSGYPDIASIKDLGSLFSSPWSKKFFVLFGKRRSLDNIEHDMIRVPGAYDDPRIHFSVVCASIGCPGLRNEAFTGSRLDQQLEDSLHRFLADHSRNRYDPQQKSLYVSKLFDWYADDFAGGFRGHESVLSFLRDYADILAANPTEREEILNEKVGVDFLNYDWNLNKYIP
jgi:hypothetical protein